MSHDWETVPASEFCASVRDGTHDSPKPVAHGEFLITSRHIVGRQLDLANAYQISQADYDAINKRSKVDQWDVLLTMIGTVGEPCLVNHEPNFAIKNIGLFKSKSEETGRWLYYYLQSPDAQNLIRQQSRGSTQQYIPLGALRDFPISVPCDPKEMNAIAGVLGALDDKIEQNRRTARALERLARAIFRVWFVDFEPVNAKAEGATSFTSMPKEVFDALPTRFVDSDIGPVPEGWEVKAATEVATVAIGKTPPRKEPHWFSHDPADVRWVSIKDMGQAGAFISQTSEYLTEDAVEKCRVRRIPDKSVLFSFKLTVGRVAITDGEMTSNEAIAHFVPHSPDRIGAEYLYCYLSAFDNTNLGSTSSIATATNSKAVKTMPIIAAPDLLSQAFTSIVRPHFQLLRRLGRESRKLAAMRDYLLPKLLSGDVRVNSDDTSKMEEP